MRALSPELITGGPVDHRTDLFALGALLYTATTGQQPFEAKTELQTLQRICDHRPPPAGSLQPEIPSRMSRWIERLLAKNPDDRPQTARAVADAFEEIAEGAEPGNTLEFRRPSDPETEVLLRTLLRVDLVDSTRWVEKLGDARAAEILAEHDRSSREIMHRFDGREIDKTDGFLVLFERPVDAVEMARAYHRMLAELSESFGTRITARAGIHLGEISLRETRRDDVAQGSRRLEVEGVAKEVVQAVAFLAVGGQTLLTQGAYELSRRALVGDARDQGLRWTSHGLRSLEGLEESAQIFEVSPVRPEGDRSGHYRSLPRPRGSDRLRWGAIAAIVVGLAILLWSFLRQDPVEDLGLRRSVAVLDLHLLSSGQPASWLGSSLAELLSIHLSTGEDFRVVPRERVARMLAELSVPPAEGLAEESLGGVRNYLGVDHLVLGSYVVVGNRSPSSVRLMALVQDTRSGEILRLAPVTGTEDEPFELVARVGDLLRSTLGAGPLTGADAERVRAAVPITAEGRRLFAEGTAELRADRLEAAAELLQQAVETEPDFPLAHAALAEAQAGLGRGAEAARSAELAHQNARSLPRQLALRLEGRWQELAGDWTAAAAVYRVLWGFFPDSLEHGLQLARAQNRSGDPAAALTTAEALRALPPPLGDDPRIDLEEAVAAARLSDHQRSLAAARAAAGSAREIGALRLTAEAHLLEARALAQLGRAGEATSAFDEARQRFMESGQPLRAEEVSKEEMNPGPRS